MTSICQGTEVSNLQICQMLPLYQFSIKSLERFCKRIYSESRNVQTYGRQVAASLIAVAKQYPMKNWVSVCRHGTYQQKDTDEIKNILFLTGALITDSVNKVNESAHKKILKRVLEGFCWVECNHRRKYRLNTTEYTLKGTLHAICFSSGLCVKKNNKFCWFPWDMQSLIEYSVSTLKYFNIKGVLDCQNVISVTPNPCLYE